VIHAQPWQPSGTTRAMFQRTLAGWAMDLLELRRRGLDRPGRRDGAGGPVWPGETASPAPLRPFISIPGAALAAWEGPVAGF
jgi:hypothetical protein